MADYISESIDETELIVLRYALKLIQLLDQQTVIEILEKDIKEKEAQCGQTRTT